MNVFFPHNRILLHEHHSPSSRHVWGHYFSSQFAESNFDDISFLLCCVCHICGIIDGTCSSRCAGHPLSQSTHFSPTNLFVDTIISNIFRKSQNCTFCMRKLFYCLYSCNDNSIIQSECLMIQVASKIGMHYIITLGRDTNCDTNWIWWVSFVVWRWDNTFKLLQLRIAVCRTNSCFHI